ncbi:MAG TPA: hypothetical protein VFA76_04250 [Terriglobales bacterium]|nr:hypothetical protein [Terriglobales bacterium]
MRDIYQVLYYKEQKLQQVRREVEVLRTILPLLADDAALSQSSIPRQASPRPTLIRFERMASPAGLQDARSKAPQP